MGTLVNLNFSNLLLLIDQHYFIIFIIHDIHIYYIGTIDPICYSNFYKTIFNNNYPHCIQSF